MFADIFVLVDFFITGRTFFCGDPLISERTSKYSQIKSGLKIIDIKKYHASFLPRFLANSDTNIENKIQ